MKSLQLINTLRAFLAFRRAKSLTKRLASPDQIAVYQKHKLRSFLNGPARKVRVHAEQTGQDLHDWPMMDKSDLSNDFPSYNCAGISIEQIRAAMQEDNLHVGAFSVGASTGTSGNRGYYVLTDKERFTWLGVILSRALPDFLKQRYRVAIILPSNSRLYDSANDSNRLSLKFFDTSLGVQAQLDSIQAFAPNVVVASPRFLRAMVDQGVELDLQHVFSGAEVLSIKDREAIERHFQQTVREIYMATEGLFAVACEHGNMHLIEDHVKFEWDPVPDQPHLKKPIITDFTRETQIMVRYRMNDLVELGDRNCPCGSAFQILKSVIGRNDDTFCLSRMDGTTVHITPDVLRNTIVDAHKDISDFRLILIASNHIKLQLLPEQFDLLDTAKNALHQTFTALNVDVNIQTEASKFNDSSTGKRRRVYVNKAQSE